MPCTLNSKIFNPKTVFCFVFRHILPSFSYRYLKYKQTLATVIQIAPKCQYVLDRRDSMTLLTQEDKKPLGMVTHALIPTLLRQRQRQIVGSSQSGLHSKTLSRQAVRQSDRCIHAIK